MTVVTAMSGAFGANVDGVDASKPLEDGEVRLLADALYEHRILVIRGQSLTNADYARFGGYWGDPIMFFVPEARDKEFSELIRIRNSPNTPEVSRDGAMHWHSDSSYEAVPASVTMLLAVEVPEAGNDTLFADCVAAYDALPDETRRRIRDLEVIHDPKGGKVHLESEKRGGGQSQPLPIVTHPLVMRHPVTGRRSLFGFSGTAAGIVGMAENEAIALLLELKRHVLQPQFGQRARAAVGSILVWDNYSAIHSATPTEYSDDDGKRRLLYRISTRGVPHVYRSPAP